MFWPVNIVIPACAGMTMLGTAATQAVPMHDSRPDPAGGRPSRKNPSPRSRLMLGRLMRLVA
jgi:hypothetical protein